MFQTTRDALPDGRSACFLDTFSIHHQAQAVIGAVWIFRLHWNGLGQTQLRFLWRRIYAQC